MASQTEKDTAKAASRTQADTAKAAARTSSTNAQTQADTAKAAAQTQADTAKAKSRQNGGDGGTSERMSQREAAAGLNLAGNNTMSGRGQPMPTMSEREAAAGLNLAGNQTVTGREDSFYVFTNNLPGTDGPIDHGVHDQTDDRLPLSQEAFASVICVNGKPHYASIQGIIGDEIV
jgi:hypothetical protein